MNPSLLVLARPTITEGIEEFLSTSNLIWTETTSATPVERLVEFAGRICYMSFGLRQHRKNNREYIRNLIDQGHESVLEHASWTLLLTGVSRAFSHQLVRHRIGFSFSQLSQQYHDESDAGFVEPYGIEGSPKAVQAWRKAIETAREAYRIIMAEVDTGATMSTTKEMNRAIRSAARSVLLNATMTTIVVTANARAIRDFLKVRGAIEGDYEMRMVSKLMYDMMIAEAPSLVDDFECHTLGDGTPTVAVRSNMKLNVEPVV